jgi:hypothetical protein
MARFLAAQTNLTQSPLRLRCNALNDLAGEFTVAWISTPDSVRNHGPVGRAPIPAPEHHQRTLLESNLL